MRKPTADDGDDWVEVEEPRALSPADVQDLTPGNGAVNDLLLELAVGVLRLNVHLAEADEEEWKGSAARLRLFMDLVGQLPSSPRKRRVVGFKVASKGRRKVRRPRKG